MDTQRVQHKLATLSAGLEGVRLLYLFGSRALGTPGPMSDVDLGVLLDPAADGPQMQAELTHRADRALETARADVLLLNQAPVELAYAVISQGILLYERDVATRVEYEATVMSRYGDYLPVLRAQRRDILQGDDHVQRVQRYREAFGRTERALGEIGAAYGQDKGGL
jgi:predicted nucleotidyltransferase